MDRQLMCGRANTKMETLVLQFGLQKCLNVCILDSKRNSDQINPSGATHVRFVTIAPLLCFELLDASVEYVWIMVMLDSRVLHSKREARVETVQLQPSACFRVD